MKVKNGLVADELAGWVGSAVLDEGGAGESQRPLEWYVQPGRLHSFSTTPCRDVARGDEAVRSVWDEAEAVCSRPRDRKARSNLLSKRV